VLFDQVCQLDHEFSSFCAGNVSPFSFECLSCCGNGLVDVLGCTGFDRADLTLIAVSFVLVSLRTREVVVKIVARLQRGASSRPRNLSESITKALLRRDNYFGPPFHTMMEHGTRSGRTAVNTQRSRLT
jgi:hypothetical protein